MKNLKSVTIIGILLIIAALFLNGCGSPNERVKGEFSLEKAVKYLKENSTKEIPKNVQGIILPHHLLVESFMDRYYKQLAEKISGERKISRIILISPNHFGYGFNYIQSTDESDKQIFDVLLDSATIGNLEALGALKIEPKYFEREHGLTSHFPFLKKYFPQAKVVPIILKRNIPEKNLNLLIDKLVGVMSDGETLVIASIDFSHYSSEDFSLENDERMVKWLKGMGECGALNQKDCSEKNFADVAILGKSLDEKTEGAVGVDSPESVFVMNGLMKKIAADNFQLWQRTSSANMTGSHIPEENTSHLFGSYGL